jgi:hypothetical protein
MNQAIAEALRAREQRHWARVDLGGLATIFQRKGAKTQRAQRPTIDTNRP